MPTTGSTTPGTIPIPTPIATGTGWCRRLNRDLPYDLFAKAQIAGDLLHSEEPGRFAGGLGLYGLSPRLPDDRVDVTTRTFLGLTVACAKCHDHKYDPIPTRDFYSLQGVFQSTQSHEFPLASEAVVSEYQKRAKRIADLETDLKEFLNRETLQLGDILANQTSRFLEAARQVLGKPRLPVADAARQAGLDAETLQRWINHLNTWPKELPYLDDWPQRLQAPEEDFRKWAEEFQARVISVSREQKVLDRRNRSAPKGKPREVMEADKAGFWNAFYFNTPRPDLPYRPPLGIYYYGEVNQYPGNGNEGGSLPEGRAAGICGWVAGGDPDPEGRPAGQVCLPSRHPGRGKAGRPESPHRRQQGQSGRELPRGVSCRSCRKENPRPFKREAAGWNWPKPSPIPAIP